MIISYAITVKDELQQIKKLLLEHIFLYKQPQDEVIVIYDSRNGSKDVKQFLDSINNETFTYYEYEFRDSFCDLKNFLISKCTGDYIFNFDADEYITQEQHQNILHILRNNQNIDVFMIPRINIVENVSKEIASFYGIQIDQDGNTLPLDYPDYQSRLFKRNQTIKWINDVHELLVGAEHVGQLTQQYEHSFYHVKSLEKHLRQTGYYTLNIINKPNFSELMKLQIDALNNENMVLNMTSNLDTTINNTKRYFTNDWFSRNIPIWNYFLKDYVGKEDLNFLEIGCYEGKSTCWLLDNILKHPTSKITCIDTFSGSYEHKDNTDFTNVYNVFLNNISDNTDKVLIKVGKSQHILLDPEIKKIKYDFIYVDGSHEAKDVLCDSILCFKLLKKGGIMIFDDYAWGDWANNPQMTPKIAIESFAICYKNEIEIKHVEYQVIIKKISD